tara:strand:+ start:10927 stop:11328 length:402 start_codon:yes stop_codon:yes gene_type:complete
MYIGEAAKASGVNAKLIRYYESIGLIRPALRTETGYRHYSDKEVHNLQFIKRARSLGFSIEQIQRLIGLWNDKERASADVKAIALDHIAELEEKIAQMQEMVNTLRNLAQHCHGDDRPDCPILADLETQNPDI